ncbi:UvrD-helicase domain-containing protein [Peribacillus frigoritolerans]|uniref:HelD family protein n=1 Tax=Peribacillus frigoritolerans TaxID=450367 RepID=UPI002E1BC258|nr:UvrD-helicase domain-containing protein [Peribacillus frigoritolerans]MED3757627.1 UvrD-helicase domain-containing protein [Peribacillus frigoritolerans]
MKGENSMKNSIIKEEQITLDSKLVEIDEIIGALSNELKNSSSKDITLERTNRDFIAKYSDAKKNPYFARVDTYEDGKKETFYIGHTSIAKDKNEDIIYSWKSSIGDLFYEFNGGAGEVIINRGYGERYTFNVVFKRSLRIEKLKVKSYTDVISQLASNKVKSEQQNDFLFDDVLLELLNDRGNKTQLKDIIMTIQKEQNDIIRQPLNTSIIVQGVAGSGKSSIALSRISYLLTRYKERLNTEDLLIIGPNKMFLSYIQDVLPTLEIDDISQLTFMSLAVSIIKELKNVKEPINLLDDYLIGEKMEHDFNIEKTTIHFKNKIDLYLEEFEKQFLEEIKGFEYYDPYNQCFVTLSKEEIISKYNQLGYIPLEKKYSNTLKFVERWVDEFLDHKQKELKEEFDNIIKVVLTGLPEGSSLRTQVFNSVEKAYTHKIKMLREALNLSWKTYAKEWPKIELFSLYKRIIDLEMAEHSEGATGKNISLNAFKKNFKYEDVAPLMYLHTILNGNNKLYQHIVIDEAQDLSPFQIYVLKELCHSMSLLGDVTQSIYLDQGLKDWNVIIKEVFNENKVNLMEMNTSYRSTNQIMESANLILKNSKLDFPEIFPIGRTGIKVAVSKIINPPDLLENIIESIKEIQNRGYKKIAVIHKDLKKSISLHKHLLDQISSLQLVTSPDESILKDVIVIPSYLTKGLEFDAVILPNANKLNFSLSELDTKLLFVSITRAQHYLKIFYHEELSPLLNGIEYEEPVMIDNGDYSYL